MEAVRYRSLESMIGLNEAPQLSFSSYGSFLGGYVPAVKREKGYAMHSDGYVQKAYHRHDSGYGSSRDRFDTPLEVYLGKSSITAPTERMGSYLKHCHSCGRERNPHMDMKTYGNDSYSMADHETKQAVRFVKSFSVSLLN